MPINSDLNSGAPVGFGLPPITSYKGKRTTSASAYLPENERPSNLRIVTNSRVTRVVFDGNTATGVETAGGRICECFWPARQ